MIDHDFWHQRWRDSNTPFHRASVHPMLERFYPTLELAPSASVFVPLCGKAADMAWLRDRGHTVLGVELSDIACRDFFIEQGIDHRTSSVPLYTRFEGDQITLLAGDFFNLTHDDLVQVDAVYDRAALVALPPRDRVRYASLLCAQLPASAPVLLVSLDYPQHRMDGPPFAVGVDEIHDLFEARFQIQSLGEMDIIDEEPRFRDRGLDSLIERAHRLTPRA